MNAHGAPVATRLRARIDATREATRGCGLVLIGESDAAREAIDASISGDGDVALARIEAPTQASEAYRHVLDRVITALDAAGAIERVARAILVRAAAESALRPVQRQTAVATPFAALRDGSITAPDLITHRDALWRCTRDRIAASDPEVDLGFIEVVTKRLVPSLRTVALRCLRGLRLEPTAATLLGVRGADAAPRGATEEDARRALRQWCKACRLAWIPLVVAIDGLGDGDTATGLVDAIENLVRYEPGLVVIATVGDADAAALDLDAFDESLSLATGDTADPAPTLLADALSADLRAAAERFRRENDDTRTAHIRPPMSPSERDTGTLSPSIDPVGCYFGLFEDAIAGIEADPASTPDAATTATAACDVIAALSRRGVRFGGAAIGAAGAARNRITIEFRRGDACDRHELDVTVDADAAHGTLALDTTDATQLVAAARLRREQPRVGSHTLATAEVDRMMVQSQMLDDHPLMHELRRLACTVLRPQPVAAHTE